MFILQSAELWKKMNFKILDCTLRDGGYYTNWNFSSELLEKYLSVISKLPIEEVEIGYVSLNKKDSKGLFYHLNNNYLKKVKSSLRKNQSLCCMIDAKEIKTFSQLNNLISRHSSVDIFRFAINPKKIDLYINLISKIKKKFPKKYFRINLMYLSKWYKDLSYANKLIKKINTHVDEIALVDSFGSLKPIETYNFFKDIIKNNPNRKIGCHFHNNCGLALANTLSAIEAGCRTADTTLKGMGRGAGNAETELLLSILRTKNLNISSYDFDNLLAIFENLKNKMKWGSSFSYSCSAIKGYSQAEMMDLIQKRRLDTSIALATISSKLKKNNSKIKFNNLKNIKFLKKNIPIIIGGAKSFYEDGEILLKNLKKDIPIVLSGSNAFKNYKKINFKPKNKVILILSGSEMKKIVEIKQNNFLLKNKIDFIIIEKDFFSKELNKINENRIIFSESVALNPLYLFGKLLISLRIKDLNLAFFDGDFETEKGKVVMQETLDSLKSLKKKLNISSLTKTFLNVPVINPWNNDKLLHTY